MWHPNTIHLAVDRQTHRFWFSSLRILIQNMIKLSICYHMLMSSKFSISIFVGCIPYAVGPTEPTAHSAYFCIPSTSFVGPLGRQWLLPRGHSRSPARWYPAMRHCMSKIQTHAMGKTWWGIVIHPIMRILMMNNDHKIHTNGLTTILQHDQHEQFTQVLTEFGASEVAAPTPLPG